MKRRRWTLLGLGGLAIFGGIATSWSQFRSDSPALVFVSTAVWLTFGVLDVLLVRSLLRRQGAGGERRDRRPMSPMLGAAVALVGLGLGWGLNALINKTSTGAQFIVMNVAFALGASVLLVPNLYLVLRDRDAEDRT